MLDLEFKLQPSKRYLFFIFFLTLFSALLVLKTPMMGVLNDVAALAVLIYGATMGWRYGYLAHPHSILQIRRCGNGKWWVHTLHKNEEATLSVDSTVTHQVMVLRFKLKHAFLPYTSLIFPDSLPQDKYRQLLVLLYANDQPAAVYPLHQ